MSSELRFTYTTDQASGVDFLETSYADGRTPDAFDAKLDAATNAAACRTEARFLSMEHLVGVTKDSDSKFLTSYHDLMKRAIALDAFVQDLS